MAVQRSPVGIVLTLSRDYFRMRKPLQRRIYELARKHCGRQVEWSVSVATLAKKTGSASPLRVFRAMLREMIRVNRLPDYILSEEAGRHPAHHPARRGPGTRRRPAPASRNAGPSPRPGADIHALQAEWRNWWRQRGGQGCAARKGPSWDGSERGPDGKSATCRQAMSDRRVIVANLLGLPGVLCL